MSTLTARRLSATLSPEQVLELCGYHEAGHAFCFAVFGIPQNGVTVSMRKRWFSSRYDYTALTHIPVKDKDIANQANLAVCILAGTAAESWYMAKQYDVDYDKTLRWNMNDELSASQDMREFHEALSNARPHYSRAHAIRDTTSILRRHWGRIDKIATKAIFKGHLTGAQVRRYAGV